jgi:hypothetical protein
MRFSEFNLINEAQDGTKGQQADVPHFDAPGYFTVGDSHSNGVGNYGRGKIWKSMGMDGARSDNPMHLSAINRIPKGSIVAISLGANDLGKIGKPGTPIPEIVGRVTSLIDLAQTKGLTVVYLLPTSNAPSFPHDPKRDKLRSAMQQAVSVPIVDLGQASDNDKKMGLHLDWNQYIAIGKRIASEYKIRNLNNSAEQSR